MGLLALCDNVPEKRKGGLIVSHVHHILEKEGIYFSGALSCIIQNG